MLEEDQTAKITTQSSDLIGGMHVQGNIDNELIEGLWVSRLQFPSKKQIQRINMGFKYDDEIYLRDYKKDFSLINELDK